MPLAACSRLCSWNSAWAGVFARSTRSSVLSALVIVLLDLLMLKVYNLGLARK